MPDARALSANVILPQHVAEAALARPNGVTLTFLSAEHGGLQGAAHRARSFQQSFTSMRARARGLSQRKLGESNAPRYSMARGPYDGLACIRRVLDDGAGWAVDIIPADQTLSSLHLTDRATGLPVDTVEGPTNEIFILTTRHNNAAMGHGHPLTPAERERLKSLAGDDVFEILDELASGTSDGAGADVPRDQVGTFASVKPRDILDSKESELGWMGSEEQ